LKTGSIVYLPGNYQDYFSNFNMPVDVVVEGFINLQQFHAKEIA